MQNVAKVLDGLYKKKDSLCEYIINHNLIHKHSQLKKLIQKKNIDFEEIDLKYQGEAAYSINKGERIGMCVYHKDKLIQDDNLMFFVLLHELAHIVSSKYAHDKEFWNNFRLLLQIAENANLYHYIDYNVQHDTYCGHNINHTPYKK
tara:strand:- start:405 stop:845 length:441 start_codon:yes stop_codon:yes gene_type:complete